MSQHDDIHHHVKIYMRVFGALMFLTIVTVAVSYMHLSAVAAAIAVALAIAIVKGSLVAGYFMHLVAERKIIYAALILTAALLTFVDSVKELPATLILRPFDFETLATSLYNAASLEQLAGSGPAALAIVLVGLAPVMVLARTLNRSRPGEMAH